MSDPTAAARELLLLAAFHDSSRTVVDRASRLAGSIEWETAIPAAHFHLLEPALWQLLSPLDGIPLSVKDALRTSALAGSARNLMLTSAISRLQTLLNNSGTESLILKGPVLAVEAYGDLSRRWFTDIDVLVRTQDAMSAFKLLESAGFASVYPLDQRWRVRYFRRFYELSFRDRLGVSVDLHWSLLDSQYSFCPSELDAWSNTRLVDVRGVPVRTLSSEMTAKYLCLHVAKHHWDRLGWIADIAHWMLRGPAVNWGQLARDPAAGRHVMITLGLIERLSGQSIPQEVRELIANDRLVREQVTSVQSRLLQSSTPSVTRSAHWRTEFARAMPSWVDRWRSFYSTLFRPSILEWMAVPLPEALSPLYAVIRPCRLAWKRLTRSGRATG